MKKILGFILGFILCIALNIANTAYAQKNQTLIGTISGFECGDNCYLTLVDKKGKEHQALCSDVLCEKLMDYQDSPSLGGYKGKTVQAKVTKGQQFDGAGNVMGTMDAFENIKVLR